MPPLVVYGGPVSQPTRAVIWACLMHGLKHELRWTLPAWVTSGEWNTQSPGFLAINPWGTVPTIDDEGFILSESAAILCYLAGKHGWKDVYPADVQQRARVDQYLHWHHEHTRKLSPSLFFPVLRGNPKSPPDIETATKVLTQLEQYLGDKPFFCGDALSVADLLAYCEVGQLQPQFFGLWEFGPSYPNLSRWLAVMAKQPGHDEAHKGGVKFKPKFAEMKQKFEEACLVQL
eukprot:RCo039383